MADFAVVLVGVPAFFAVLVVVGVLVGAVVSGAVVVIVGAVVVFDGSLVAVLGAVVFCVDVELALVVAEAGGVALPVVGAGGVAVALLAGAGAVSPVLVGAGSVVVDPLEVSVLVAPLPVVLLLESVVLEVEDSGATVDACPRM